MDDTEKYRLGMIADRALISVQVDYRQYTMMMSRSYEPDAVDSRWAVAYRENAKRSRYQAQMAAWIVSGRWPQRTAKAA